MRQYSLIREKHASSSAFKNLNKRFLATAFLFTSLCYLLIVYDVTETRLYRILEDSVSSSNSANYLVHSFNCKIPKVDPFTPESLKFIVPRKYQSCRNHSLLTYVNKSDRESVVHVRKEIVYQYTNLTIKCCYSNVTRTNLVNDTDSSIEVSNCAEFHNEIVMPTETMYIKCTEKETNKTIYENVHTTIRKTEEIENKINRLTNTSKPLSVLFIGIDSVSRLNFIRTMPETHAYVEQNDWLPLKGYNKIDDNTFPNLMAIFTGFNQTQAYDVCQPKIMGMLDKCPLIWYTYKNVGYVTAYAEDEAPISTFNFYKKGFTKPPTDFYFRPYVLASETLQKNEVYGITYCTGPEPAGERILNLVRDFSMTFSGDPKFGFFWMNTFSHNDVSAPTMMDSKVKLLLEDLASTQTYENSIVILLSDHGMRFGDFRQSPGGWLEERLPFIYVWFPPRFKHDFSEEYQNFVHNKYKLTTPYDLYLTLQHILILSGIDHKMAPSRACPKCKSLFQKIEDDRSCEDAAIDQHWCTCEGYFDADLEQDVKDQLSTFLVDQLYQITSATDQGKRLCAKYQIKNITSVKLSSKKTDILVAFQTKPKAVFETTVKFEGDIKEGKFTAGPISRLDFYSGHSFCVEDATLKKYCYCRARFLFVF